MSVIVRSSHKLARDDREDDQHYEQDHRLGGSQAHTELLECRLVNLVSDHSGGVRRAASGEVVDQIKSLEIPDDGGDKHEEGGWSQHRHGHVPELRNGSCSIDLCGLIEVSRNAL